MNDITTKPRTCPFCNAAPIQSPSTLSHPTATGCWLDGRVLPPIEKWNDRPGDAAAGEIQKVLDGFVMNISDTLMSAIGNISEAGNIIVDSSGGHCGLPGCTDCHGGMA